MKIPVERWFKAIKLRHSRRKYIENRPVEKNILESLADCIDIINRKNDGVRIELVEEGFEEINRGIIGSYGLIRGASSYAAFICDKKDPDHMVKTGYYGEAFILEATALGLGTCWIGGFFKRDAVKKQLILKDNEEVLAVTPVGYVSERLSLMESVMKRIISSHKRKELDLLCKGGFNKDWPDWIKTALKCARLAPSAVNRQPWRFMVEGEKIKIKTEKEDSKIDSEERLDCGIAMLHLEIGALYEGVKGEWKHLNPPDVAVFSKV